MLFTKLVVILTEAAALTLSGSSIADYSNTDTSFQKVSDQIQEITISDLIFSDSAPDEEEKSEKDDLIIDDKESEDKETQTETDETGETSDSDSEKKEDSQKSDIAENEENTQTTAQADEKKESSPAETARQARNIDVSGVWAEFQYPYSWQFMDQIRSGNDQLYYSGYSGDADYSLGEIYYNYCCLNGYAYYYPISDGTGTYLSLTPETGAEIRNTLAWADSQWARYQNAVYSACASLDLTGDDYQIVEDIYSYIIDHYDYVAYDCAYMPHFTDTGTGQCYHYAKMFADMCTSVGINAWKVEGNNHAWDQVEIDGTVYTFDPTYGDTTGNRAAYEWQ